MASASEEWKAGWKLVLASFCGFYSFTIMLASMSVFMGPLSEAFGWSRTLLSAGTALSAVVTVLGAPIFGGLMDRYGPRRIALPGLVLSALAIVAMAANNGSALVWLGLWLFYAVSALFVNTPVWAVAVTGMFDKARGIALAVALAGATAAHASIPPLALWLIDAFGWRLAFALLGGSLGMLAVVVCYFLFHDGREPMRSGPVAVSPSVQASALQPAGLTLAEAWRSTALWRIGISVLVIMLLTIGFLFHQVEILVEVGITRADAALLAGVAGGMGIAGKLVTGFLIDRFRGSLVGGITMSCAALAFLILFAGAKTMPLLIFAMLVNGYTAGAKLHIASYLTAQYSGIRNYGKIFGAMTSLIAVGSGGGPIIAGAIYDLTGSYDAFLLVGTGGLILSGALLFTLPPYPDWRQREKAAIG